AHQPGHDTLSLQERASLERDVLSPGSRVEVADRGGILWITTELMRHCAMPTTHAIYLSALEYSTTLVTCLSKRSVSSQQLSWLMTTHLQLPVKSYVRACAPPGGRSKSLLCSLARLLGWPLPETSGYWRARCVHR